MKNCFDVHCLLEILELLPYLGKIIYSPPFEHVCNFHLDIPVNNRIDPSFTSHIECLYLNYNPESIR